MFSPTGSPANSAVYFALWSRKTKNMGLSLDSGGHLTTAIQKLIFRPLFSKVQYAVARMGLDYEKLKSRQRNNGPKLLPAPPPSADFDFTVWPNCLVQVGAYL